MTARIRLPSVGLVACACRAGPCAYADSIPAVPALPFFFSPSLFASSLLPFPVSCSSSFFDSLHRLAFHDPFSAWFSIF
jgi:hypothetical protein